VLNRLALAQLIGRYVIF